jgi:hypothetical protein
MSNERDDGYLRDSEIALNAIKTIFEILIAKKLTTPATIDRMLASQSKAYEGGEMDPGIICDEWTSPLRGRSRKSSGSRVSREIKRGVNALSSACERLGPDPRSA